MNEGRKEGTERRRKSRDSNFYPWLPRLAYRRNLTFSSSSTRSSAYFKLSQVVRERWRTEQHQEAEMRWAGKTPWGSSVFSSSQFLLFPTWFSQLYFARLLFSLLSSGVFASPRTIPYISLPLSVLSGVCTPPCVGVYIHLGETSATYTHTHKTEEEAKGRIPR